MTDQDRDRRGSETRRRTFLGALGTVVAAGPLVRTARAAPSDETFTPVERSGTAVMDVSVDGSNMADVAVIGGGPAGLSAALFAAKNGLDTIVFDTDETWMHQAHLYNYLGIEDMGGTEFMEIARDQVDDFGVERHRAEVTAVEDTEAGFSLRTQDGGYNADYAVIAAGDSVELAEGLGCDVNEDGTVVTDGDNETTVDDAYAAGRMISGQKMQAVISAGDGAVAAIDILSKEAGEPFHDFDTPN